MNQLSDINSNITDFSADRNNCISFKSKQQLTGQSGIYDIKEVEIMVSLKHLSNFWRTLEMALINCEISLMLTWSKSYFSLTGTAANKQRKSQYLQQLIQSFMFQS